MVSPIPFQSSPKLFAAASLPREGGRHACVECCTCRMSARLQYTSLRRYAHAPRARGRRTFFVASNFDKAKERSVGALKARPRSNSLKARPQSNALKARPQSDARSRNGDCPALSGSAPALHCCSFVRIFAKTEGAVTAGRGRSLRPSSGNHGGVASGHASRTPYSVANANRCDPSVQPLTAPICSRRLLSQSPLVASC